MSEIPVTLLHSLLAAGATLLAEHGGRTAISSVKARALRKVWSFLESDTHVFLSLLRPLRDGAAIGFGDLLAVSAIAEMKNRHFPSGGALMIHSSPSDFESAKTENLIVLGGGRYNSIYRRLVDASRLPLHFFDTADESFSDIRDASHSIVFAPTYDDSHVVQRDTGLLARVKNPFAPFKVVVLAAGSHSFATGAAIRYMTSSDGIADMRTRTSLNCEIIVQCGVSNGSITDVSRVSQVIEW